MVKSHEGAFRVVSHYRSAAICWHRRWPARIQPPVKGLET